MKPDLNEEQPRPQVPAPAARTEGDKNPWISTFVRAVMAIADGAKTDWQAMERLARRPQEVALLRKLQKIEDLAGHCRAQETALPLPSDDEALSLSLSQLLASIQRLSTAQPLKPDELVSNRYRVKSLLGRGGMADVYEAWDEELAIPVALKMLHVETGSESATIRSLKHEALLARAVVHPNVCRVYDLGCHSDGEKSIWFLTMEVLRGVTLAQRLREVGRLTPEVALPWVEQMASALEAAHQAGVVHLDFKSGNVILVGEGERQAVVTDFGLARTAGTRKDESEDALAVAVVAGTPAYMAPEQVRGRPAGPAADIYALGVVLYEMVTGELPFTGDTALEVANRRLVEAAPSPRHAIPDLDQRWEAVIGRCLDRDPSRRFARAGEVSAALAGRVTVAIGDATATSYLQRTLPVERDSFVGREEEFEVLDRMLAGQVRLVTLLGAGGMGKTRLATRYGWNSHQHWPGGVWFCDLTEVRDMNGVMSAVARSLGVPLGRGDLVEQLGRAIAGRERCLLIIDNVEQVVAPATTALRRWLEQTRTAHFLVTSRQRLDLSGGEVLSVEPLGVEPSLKLFIDRAKRLRPAFELDSAELAAVQEVVHLVEGIPLAIELAAARMRVMDAAQLVAGMRKRFSLLTGGPRERHETLRAAIDGSWDLLLPWEKAALAQCSVFEGGFTVEAAESVLDLSAHPEAPWTLDVLQSLVDRSLLRSWVPQGMRSTWVPSPRFGMYVSIQEYARAKLASAEAVPQSGGLVPAVLAAEERHGRWYARQGSEEALAALDQHGGVERRWALGNELENLAAACRRAVARGDGETTSAAYRAVWAVLSIRGPYRPAVDLGLEAITGPWGDEERTSILFVLGQSEQYSGRMEEARSRTEAVLAFHRARGNRLGEGIALSRLASIHSQMALTSQALEYFEAALRILRECGNRQIEAAVLGNCGNLHRDLGRMKEARGHYETALTFNRELGNRRGEGVILANLGGLSFEDGQIDEARAALEAALAIHREVGDRKFESTTLLTLGAIDSLQGRREEARRRFEVSLALNRELGYTRGEGAALVNDAEVLESLADQCTEEEEREYLAAARDRYAAALSLFQEVGDRRWEGVVLGNMGSLCLRQGLFDEGWAHLETALGISQEVGDRRSEGINQGNLGKLFLKQGRIEEAREALIQAEALLRGVNTPFALGQLLCIRAELEYRSGDQQQARTILAEVEGIAAEIGWGPDSDLERVLAKTRQLIS